MPGHVNGGTAVNGHGPALDRAARRRAERDVAGGEVTLAQLIGKQVALELVPLLAEMQPAPVACALHAGRYKQALKAWHVAVQNALAAAEEPPAQPEPGIPQAFTWMPVQLAQGAPPVSVPVCFDCFDTGPDVRPAGLVDAAGTPIIARRG